MTNQDNKNIYDSEKMVKHFRLGEHLLQRKIITIFQLSETLSKQQKTGKLIGEILLEEGYITDDQLTTTLEWQRKIDSFTQDLLDKTKNQFEIKEL